MTKDQISFEEFEQIDMRCGEIKEVEDFVEADSPAYKIKTDFGEKVGEKWSMTQAKEDYSKDELIGKEVIGVVNLTPMKVAGFKSEALLVGVHAEDGGLSLLQPDRNSQIGSEVY